jgi:hypothetical protein
MINSHWTCYGTEKSFVPNEDKFGFVYIITNTKNGKAYVGCKQYYSMTKKKTKHKWEMYTGSSKYLNKDIEKIGKEHFTFEVIAEYKNKRSLRYYEMYYQVKWNVLTATIEGTDKPAFYNSYVGGKFRDPEYLKILSKARLGEKGSNAIGPHKLTFEDGSYIIVPNLARWAKDSNKYDWAQLFHLKKGYKIQDGKKIRILKCKDIIKVEKVND